MSNPIKNNLDKNGNKKKESNFLKKIKNSIGNCFSNCFKKKNKEIINKTSEIDTKYKEPKEPEIYKRNIINNPPLTRSSSLKAYTEWSWTSREDIDLNDFKDL